MRTYEPTTTLEMSFVTNQLASDGTSYAGGVGVRDCALNPGSFHFENCMR